MSGPKKCARCGRSPLPGRSRCAPCAIVNNAASAACHARSRAATGLLQCCPSPRQRASGVKRLFNAAPMSTLGTTKFKSGDLVVVKGLLPHGQFPDDLARWLADVLLPRLPPGARYRVNMRAMSYAQRRDAGLCGVAGCPTKAPGGRSHCAECSAKANASHRCTAARWRREGLCLHCGKETAPASTTMCPTCLANHARNNLERYHGLREQGLCPDCGDPPAQGRVRCARCQDRHNANARARAARAKPVT